MSRARRAALALAAAVALVGCAPAREPGTREGSAPVSAGEAPTATSSGNGIAAGPRSVAAAPADGADPAAASVPSSSPSPAVVVTAELSAAATAPPPTVGEPGTGAAATSPSDPPAPGCAAALHTGSAAAIDLATSQLDCPAAQAVVADYHRAIDSGLATGNTMTVTLPAGWICAYPTAGAARTGGYAASCRLGDRAILLVG